jgi:hypothetical protein
VLFGVLEDFLVVSEFLGGSLLLAVFGCGGLFFSICVVVAESLSTTSKKTPSSNCRFWFALELGWLFGSARSGN